MIKKCYSRTKRKEIRESHYSLCVQTANGKFYGVCLQNRASFGKSQLLNWANFGKSKQKQNGAKIQSSSICTQISFFLKETKIRKVQRLSDDRLEVPFIHCCLSCNVDPNAKVGTRLEHRHGHL